MPRRCWMSGLLPASKTPLEPLVKAGTFREDLYYRMNVVTIEIPPLRERAEDIPLLAQRFVQTYGSTAATPVTGISPEAMRLISDYWWPGNVRELEHAIERAVALSSHSIICPEVSARSEKRSTASSGSRPGMGHVGGFGT